MKKLLEILSGKTQEEKIDILSSELDYLEDAMSLALELATIGIWDWNIETNDLTWDTNMLKLFNVSKFGGTYDMFLDLLNINYITEVDTELHKSIENGSIYDVTYELRHVKKFIRGRGKCIYDPMTNKPIRFIGYVSQVHIKNVGIVQRKILKKYVVIVPRGN